MMAFSEKLVPLLEAVNFIPSAKTGKHLSQNTLYRWALKGVRGVKLETVLIGKSRFTSREAVSRFSERLSERPADHCNPAVASPIERDRDHRQADERCERTGW